MRYVQTFKVFHTWSDLRHQIQRALVTAEFIILWILLEKIDEIFDRIVMQFYLIGVSWFFRKLDRSPSSPYSKMALKGSSSTIAIILAILTSCISAKVCMSFIKSSLKWYIFVYNSRALQKFIKQNVILLNKMYFYLKESTTPRHKDRTITTWRFWRMPRSGFCMPFASHKWT